MSKSAAKNIYRISSICAHSMPDEGHVGNGSRTLQNQVDQRSWTIVRGDPQDKPPRQLHQLDVIVPDFEGANQLDLEYFRKTLLQWFTTYLKARVRAVDAVPPGGLHVTIPTIGCPKHAPASACESASASTPSEKEDSPLSCESRYITDGGPMLGRTCKMSDGGCVPYRACLPYPFVNVPRVTVVMEWPRPKHAIFHNASAQLKCLNLDGGLYAKADTFMKVQRRQTEEQLHQLQAFNQALRTGLPLAPVIVQNVRNQVEPDRNDTPQLTRLLQDRIRLQVLKKFAFSCSFAQSLNVADVVASDRNVADVTRFVRTHSTRYFQRMEEEMRGFIEHTDQPAKVFAACLVRKLLNMARDSPQDLASAMLQAEMIDCSVSHGMPHVPHVPHVPPAAPISPDDPRHMSNPNYSLNLSMKTLDFVERHLFHRPGWKYNTTDVSAVRQRYAEVVEMFARSGDNCQMQLLVESIAASISENSGGGAPLGQPTVRQRFPRTQRYSVPQPAARIPHAENLGRVHVQTLVVPNPEDAVQKLLHILAGEELQDVLNGALQQASSQQASSQQASSQQASSQQASSQQPSPPQQQQASTEVDTDGFLNLAELEMLN
jgi:hypothetical protein